MARRTHTHTRTQLKKKQQPKPKPKRINKRTDLFTFLHYNNYLLKAEQ